MLSVMIPRGEWQVANLACSGLKRGRLLGQFPTSVCFLVVSLMLVGGTFVQGKKDQVFGTARGG